jgi:hypothetical protein
MSTPQERSDVTGLKGYGCLISLVLAGFIGGTLLVFLGVSALMDARTPLGSVDDAAQLVTSLEGAVALSGFGALALLIGFVSAVVLLKELSDDAARRVRGPVR